MMKFVLFLFLLPLNSLADYSKPKLIARLSDTEAWNAPTGMRCSASEAGVLNNKVHLACTDEKGDLMAQWSEAGFKIIARSKDENFFSAPVNAFNKILWTEYNEQRVLRSFEKTDEVKVTEVINLGPAGRTSDNFRPNSPDSWIYRLKGTSPELWIWKDNRASLFFNPNASFVFTPYTGPAGEVAFKSRELSNSEASPDRLWHFYGGEWKVILEDTDANPKSMWSSFRSHISVDGNKVVTIASSSEGESLILIEEGNIAVIARVGTDLAKFDDFPPKMRKGVVAIRGEDFERRKVIYTHDGRGFRRLLTQGDTVHTDKGIARIQSLYGQPDIDEEGNIVVQATLVDADYPSTTLGNGVIHFKRVDFAF